jgi:hypothetical protein
MTKEGMLIEEIVSLADKHLGGERSKKALWLFTDIADECKALGHGYARLERIMREVANHYDYGDSF